LVYYKILSRRTVTWTAKSLQI